MDRKKGGLGGLKYPLLSDFSRKISYDYGVLIKDAGIALRGLFIIDPNVCTCIYLYSELSNKRAPTAIYLEAKIGQKSLKTCIFM